MSYSNSMFGTLRTLLMLMMAVVCTFDDLIEATRPHQVYRVEAEGCLHGFSDLTKVRNTLQAIWRPHGACRCTVYGCTSLPAD